MFLGLLSFRRSLATKCLSLTNELCKIWPAPIDLNPVKLKYYLFMVTLDKCSGCCNAVDNLSTKICVSSKTKGINVNP